MLLKPAGEKQRAFEADKVSLGLKHEQLRIAWVVRFDGCRRVRPVGVACRTSAATGSYRYKGMT